MKRSVKSRVLAFIIGLLFLAGCAAFVSAVVFDQTTLLNQLLKSWWTLFLIIPGFMGLFQRGARLGSFGLLLVGIGLLVRSQGWFGGLLDNTAWWHIVVAVLLLIVGLSIIGGALGIGRRHRANYAVHAQRAAHHGTDLPVNSGGDHVEASFSEENVSYNGREFNGGKMTASFGSLNLDLGGAIISQDCNLTLDCAFGSITLTAPADVNFTITRNSVFGTVNVNRDINHRIEGAYTVNIVANAVFGSIEIN